MGTIFLFTSSEMLMPIKKLLIASTAFLVFNSMDSVNTIMIIENNYHLYKNTHCSFSNTRIFFPAHNTFPCPIFFADWWARIKYGVALCQSGMPVFLFVPAYKLLHWKDSKFLLTHLQAMFWNYGKVSPRIHNNDWLCSQWRCGRCND